MFKFFFLIKTKCFLIERNCKQCFDGIVFLSEIVVNRIVSIVINKIIIIIIKKFKIIIIISIIIIILLAQKVKYPTSRAEFLSLTCVSGDFWSVFFICGSKSKSQSRAKDKQRTNEKTVGRGAGRDGKKKRVFFPGFFLWPLPDRFLVRPQGRYSGF